MDTPDIDTCVNTETLVGKGTFGAVFKIDCGDFETDPFLSDPFLSGYKPEPGYYVVKVFQDKFEKDREMTYVNALLDLKYDEFVFTCTPIISRETQEILQDRLKDVELDDESGIYYRMIDGKTVDKFLKPHAETNGGTEVEAEMTIITNTTHNALTRCRGMIPAGSWRTSRRFYKKSTRPGPC